jgi:uncharacterized protein YndB with AHSA1/START domain
MAELKHQIPIEASPEKVYVALAMQVGLKSWWTADAKADEKVDKRAIVFRMNIEKLEPGKTVVWSFHGDQPEWNGTTLTWDLEKNHNGTTLRFTHAGWKAVAEMFAIGNSSWGELMYRLKNYVEGKNPGPHWTE